MAWRAISAKQTSQTARRCRHWQTMLHRSVQREADHPHLRRVAKRYRERKISSKSTQLAQSIWLRRFIRLLAEGRRDDQFSSVAAYTMSQTDEWTQAFEAWNEPDFMTGYCTGRRSGGRGGRVLPCGSRLRHVQEVVIYLAKNVARFRKSTAASCPSRPAVISRPCIRSSSTINRKLQKISWS